MEVRDACICVEYLMHNIDVVHVFKIAEVPTQSKRSFMTCRVLPHPSIQRDGFMCTDALLYIYIYVISHHDLYQDKIKT